MYSIGASMVSWTTRVISCARARFCSSVRPSRMSHWMIGMGSSSGGVLAFRSSLGVGLGPLHQGEGLQVAGAKGARDLGRLEGLLAAVLGEEAFGGVALGARQVAVELEGAGGVAGAREVVAAGGGGA